MRKKLTSDLRPPTSGFSWKPFQLEDIARAALADGVIFSWEQGLGKTPASLAWAIIKRARRVLLVVPGHLHRNFRNAAFNFFRLHLTSLTHRRQIHAFGLDKPLPASASQPSTLNSQPRMPRFFITTFHDLGYNNTSHGEPTLATCLAAWMQTCGAGVDCVIVDEGTHIQGDDTHLSTGVRTLNPPLRMLLTGTPIKNRLESFFHLASWAAGKGPSGSDQWPYAATAAGRAEFTRDYLAAVRAGNTNNPDAPSGRNERTARITNIHNLWRVCSPFLIRRLKVECGEAIVKKIVKPIVLKPGTAQAEVYRNHLYYPPLISSRGRPVSGFGQVAMQLNYLRQVALCPHVESLEKIQNALPPGSLRRTPTDFNPKLMATLGLVDRLLRVGEQVVVGSTFHGFSHSLHARLLEAGVSSLLLDGGTRPLARGELAEDFKRKLYSVLVAGIAAMAEGSDFDNCSHLILPSYSWAYDENAQFIDRVWRLTSKKPVHIYPLSIAGTIDDRLLELFDEKRDSANLALDYRLLGADVQELDLGLLLRQSVKAFSTAAETIDETALEQQWHARLRNRLTQAEFRFRSKHPFKNKNLCQPPQTTTNPSKAKFRNAA